MIEVFVDAFMFEPCNILKSSNSVLVDNTSQYVYLNNQQPEYLDYYIKEFHRDQSMYNNHSADDYDGLLTCVGIDSNKNHPFFSSESNSQKCFNCHNDICYCCQFQNNGNKKVCYDFTLAKYLVLDVCST